MLKRIVKEFLTFAKWEHRGIILLLLLIILIVLFKLIYSPNVTIIETPDISDKVSAFEKNIVLQQQGQELEAKKREYSFKNDRGKEKSELFQFDPNTIKVEDLYRLGFSMKQAEVINTYRSKGGKFYKAEDFKKMYVVSSEIYKKLEPFIAIELPERNAAVIELKLPMVDLNTADTSEINKLKGIGSVLAQRIANYRNQLGGFANPEQLMEVYGIDSVRYSLLKQQLSPLSSWNKIMINKVDLEMLKKHPYINAYQARSIIYYRSKRGIITDIQQLVKERIISKECSDKLKDYLDYSN